MLMNFDINLLKVMHALFLEGSTVKAAKRLNMSQPAVSSALSRLRSRLGDPLFERKGNQMVPTALALGLQPEVTQIMFQLEQLLEREAEFDPSETRRTFRWSASDYYADLIFPTLVSYFEDLAPNASLQLTPLNATDHVASLEQFQTDLIVFLSHPVPGWMRSEVVDTSSFQIIASRRNHFLSAANIKPGEIIPLDLYCAAEHGLYSPSGQTQTWVDDALIGMKRKRRISFTAPTFHSLAKTIEKTGALATVPFRYAQYATRQFALAQYQHPLADTRAQLMSAWHYRNDAKPHHIWFRELIRRCLNEISNEWPLPST